MHKAKFRAVGGSVMVAIPPHMLEALKLGPNANAEISIDGNRLIIEPKPRSGRIGLAARLAQCDFSVELTADEKAEERAWLDAPRVGREEI
jgi:antitoxin ChpS